MPYGFPYKSLEDLYEGSLAAPYPLPAPGDPSVLLEPVIGGGFALRNALAIQPMEGCDSDEGGAPTEWTHRRYMRYARGGAGLIWVEAVAVSAESRANPRQLMITEGNLESYRALASDMRAEARKEGFDPVIIVQLTHSGRFSRPGAKPAPIRAWTNPTLDAHQGLPDDWPIISDAELAEVPATFAEATRLCRLAGFDGVDVKACHLYLLNELFGASGRPAPYGGRLEDRLKIYYECVDACKDRIDGGILAARVNAYDGDASHWGVGEGGSLDLAEPIEMIRGLSDRGVKLLNITMGTPYFNPHVNRPYASGGYEPPEAPIAGVGRLLKGCDSIQREFPDMVCVATGAGYLRHYAPQVLAGAIASGGARVAGFGRGGFAYPDFARDLMRLGRMRGERCCLTCGLCTKIMRAGGRAGCPVRDAERYKPELARVTGG